MVPFIYQLLTLIEIYGKQKAVNQGVLNLIDGYRIEPIGYTGLEPVNYGFRVRCLTNLANTQ
ncbi:hypothetical protein IV64_GL001477 [Lactiplantibacillus xiangfangensis]|uniref:Uncharacterized protein n=1 Tax=Lactiplantibacillus xiangfangensis TaxID=942150 RepID=A0A0R2M043_9LACO|nr:hypothetical protein IV64_GL001477 [Lactiplantibacillus xiangfangensis]